MHDFVAMITALVKASVAAGKPVNVDVCCRQLAPLYPDLSERQLKEAVLEVVIVLGGSAEWGTDPPSRSGKRKS
jgi:hypothetical protein